MASERRFAQSSLFIWVTVAVGTVAYALWARSWRDPWHTVYDLSAAPVTFAFVAVLLGEAFRLKASRDWWAWGWLLAPLTIVPAGAHYLGWPVSGHLTDILISAAGLTMRPRLSRKALVACWVAVILVVYVRWFAFDVEGHRRTFNAAAVALLSIALTLGAQALSGKRPCTFENGEEA